MMRRIIPTFFLLALGAGALHASAVEVPEVSVVRLKSALQTLAAGEERETVELQLAEALLKAGRMEEALQTVREAKRQSPFLEAQILLSLGEWEQALPLFRKASAVSPSEPALLGEVACLVSLKERTKAINLLKKHEGRSVATDLRLAELLLEERRLKQAAELLPTIEPKALADQKWKQYLEARLLLLQGHPAYALGRFETLKRDSEGLSMELLVGAVLGISECRVQLNGVAAADDVLEEYLWKYPNSPHLAAVFQKLNEIYADDKDSSDSTLRKLMASEPPLRSGFAAFYLAKAAVRAEKPDRALKALEGFAERYPKHPLLGDALLLEGGLLTRNREFDKAQKALEAAMRETSDTLKRAEIEMASANTFFEAGEYLMAANIFQAAGERAPKLWDRAAYNVALSWLHQGNHAKFNEVYQELSEKEPKSPYRAALILEEGLLLARQGGESAKRGEQTLIRFAETFPDHPRLPEVKLALAELSFAQGNRKEASRYLKVVNDLRPSPDTAQQADYLALFVAGEKEETVIKRGEEFLERYPGSSKEAKVRMKLGQIFFKREDFASAQTQFETLAKEHPQSPLAEAALFLAAQASIKSMSEGGVDRAIGLFEEVVKLDGPLKFNARLQQAQAQNQLGKKNEAILVYDDVLRGNPPAEVRYAALAGKADNLSELGETDPAQKEEALKIYSELAALPEAGVEWRSMALFNKGRCLEALGKPEEALAAYYEVVELGVSNPREYFWFYKAGFDAARLCETRGQWKSAIAIYHKMARLDGPRAEEAKACIAQLRLEHFIWE